MRWFFYFHNYHTTTPLFRIAIHLLQTTYKRKNYCNKTVDKQSRICHIHISVINFYGKQRSFTSVDKNQS